MPTGTSDERRQLPWGDIFYRAVLMSLAGGAFGFALNVSVQLAKLEQTMISHITTHPNVGLSRRIDREQGRIDRLEDRVRELEIGGRTNLKQD